MLHGVLAGLFLCAGVVAGLDPLLRTAEVAKVTPAPAGKTAGVPAAAAGPVTEFVCEEDVRQAVRSGRKITFGGRTIVTPAARDLGDQHGIFVQAGFP